MKKKILLIYILLLIIFPNFADAKELENTCEYYGSYAEGKNVSVTCKFYDDNSHTCESTVGGTESLQNWGKVLGGGFNAKEYYSNNKKCFDYLVFIKSGLFVDIYAADTRTTASGIIGGKNDASILEYVSLDNNDKDPYEKIFEYTQALNKVASSLDPWGLKACKNVADYIEPKNDVCRNKINTFYKDLLEWNEEVANYIKENKVNKDDSRVEAYKAAVKAARAQFVSWVDKEQMGEDEDHICTDYDTKDECPNQDENGNYCYWRKSKGCVFADAPEDNDPIEIGEADCSGIFETKFGRFLKQIYSLLKFAVPIVIIAFAIIDFIKAIASGDAAETKKAANKLVKRLVIGVAIFALPTILEFILAVAGVKFGTCGIG